MLILQADTLRPVIAEQIQLAALGCHRSAAMEVQCDVVALLVEIDDVEILNIGDSKRARRIIDGTLEGRNILNTLTQMGYL